MMMVILMIDPALEDYQHLLIQQHHMYKLDIIILIR
jgi:hypothetical protein